MRLIDADALIAQMEADAEQMEDQIAMMFTYAAINDVKRAPTIEERKTGKWISNSPLSMKCDQCGTTIGDWCWYYANFCPNCGAKMEE